MNWVEQLNDEVARLNDRILVNAIECTHCGARVVSTHRHDFNAHACDTLKARGSFIAADGGIAYLRRVGSRSDWREATTWEPA